MALFEITEVTTFENVYLIEADSLDEARGIVDRDATPPDFYQRFVGAKQVAWTELVEGEPSTVDLEIARTNIMARGYA